MARTKCRLCGKIVGVDEGRSSHLRQTHGIDSRYKGAVKDYYQEA